MIGNIPTGLNGLFKLDHSFAAITPNKSVNIHTLHRKLGHISLDAIRALVHSDVQGPASGHPSPSSRAPKLELGQALLESLVGLSAWLALDEALSWGLWPRLFSLKMCPKTLKNTKKKILVF